MTECPNETGFIANVNKIANALPENGFDDFEDRLSNLENQNELTDVLLNKLTNIENNATKNETDDFLLERDNHTGTQSLDTITETAQKKIFTKAERDKLELLDPNTPPIHKHPISQITDLQNALDEKAEAIHNHDTRYYKKNEVDEIAVGKEDKNKKNIAGGYVGLDDNGKISASFLPSLTTTDVFEANSQANMLLLSNVGVGDYCVRSDLTENNVFLLKQTPSSVFSNWVQLSFSATVGSVNGKRGIVVITKDDIGLTNVENIAPADMPISTLQELALDLKSNISDIKDNLTSTDTNKPLSANQGKILKGLIDNISNLLSSDNTALDSLQEIVDFIEANKTSLEALGIGNIAGLQTALNSKANSSDIYTQTQLNLKISSQQFDKPNINIPLFMKVSASSIKIPSGFQITVNGNSFKLSTDYTLSLASNLVGSIKTVGTDYFVYAKQDGSFYISANESITADRLIGGFHYGLVGESEAISGNKTEADMVKIRGINAYSFWDLKYRPVANPKGMVNIGGVWYDIYLLNSEHITNGTSKAGLLVAGGVASNGRGIPKIPLEYGGNNTINYGKFTWFQASEVAKAHSKRLISYAEFLTITYGVLEGASSSSNGYETVAGRIEHYSNLTSKYGIEQATGVQWIWGSDLTNGYGTTDWAWKDNTDGRGQIYSTSNSPTAVLLGGARGGGVVSGSRASGWSSYVWVSYWDIGCRFACDHLTLA